MCCLVLSDIGLGLELEVSYHDKDFVPHLRCGVVRF